MTAAPADLAYRALAAVIATIGGEGFPPRFERLARLAEALGADEGQFRARTLGGCRIQRWRRGIAVLRELAAVAPPVHLDEGASRIVWDGRFLVETADGSGLELGCLGEAGVAELRAALGTTRCRALDAELPKTVWPSLPVLRRNGRLTLAPALSWMADGEPARVEVWFRPSRTLSGYGFTVV
jgi:tRNA(Ile)-lysidine synthase